MKKVLAYNLRQFDVTAVSKLTVSLWTKFAILNFDTGFEKNIMYYVKYL